MSTIDYVKSDVIPVALAMLPLAMYSSSAVAMLLAIGLQESGFMHRHQVGGPARGWWQFEEGGGVAGVMRHPASRPHVLPALARIGYGEESRLYLHEAIEHNDVLACVFARLLLWTLPAPLPERGQHELAFGQYFDAWRPGKPRRESWDRFYDQAWSLVS